MLGNYASGYLFVLVVTKSSATECPQDTIGVISPESGLATINVSLGDVLQRFKLPIGTYGYELFYTSSNCSVNVYIKGKLQHSTFRYCGYEETQ